MTNDERKAILQKLPYLNMLTFLYEAYDWKVKISDQVIKIKYGPKYDQVLIFPYHWLTCDQIEIFKKLINEK